MDIANFISDLLGQQGELSVPNLGYFVQMRASAYYNEQEKKFYPPHYSVQFDPQVIDDDDALATHITTRKNISLASSKYFIEKYVSGLRSEALTAEVPFGGIGTFSYNGPTLVFKPGLKQDDPALFGLTPLNLYGTPKETVSAPPVPVEPAYTSQTTTYTPPVAEPAVSAYSAPVSYTPPPAALPQEETQPYAQQRVEPEYEYEEEEKRGLSIWLILVMVFVLIGAAIAALYVFKPGLFNELLSRKSNSPYTTSQPITPPAKSNADSSLLKDTDTKPVKPSAPDTVNVTTTGKATTTTAQPVENNAAANTPATTTPAETKPATVKTTAKPAETKPVETKPVPTTTVKTTTVKTTAPPVTVPASTPANTASTDEVTKGSWVIYHGAFPTKSGAEGRIDLDKGHGLPARLLTNKVHAGGNYKVILGVYSSKEAAKTASEELLMTGKITRTDISIEQIH